MTAYSDIVGDFYYEVCIALDSNEISEIFTSEIMEFSGEAVEIADFNIIIRTSKNRQFIDALLAHLQRFSANLSQISGKIINFTNSIAKKQNKDWIAEYKKSIKPIRCGKFYICPPWDNLFLGSHSADLTNFEHSQTSSLVSRSKFAKNYESTTSILSVVDSADTESVKNNPYESLLNSPTSWCKKTDSKDVEVCSADFLLEAKKRGSLPKSEKVAAFWCVGGAERGVQPFLREKTSEFNKQSGKSHNDKVIDIILEPSLAFGTGHHASTFMCIEALQSLSDNGDLNGKSLLDFGCGSGILALCAEKLGAKVSLCDIDELAITESKKNFNHNNATISHIWQGGIDCESTDKYDIIMANIIASVLIEQRDNLDYALKRGGILILSGILDIYKNAVLVQFADFRLCEVIHSDEWICIILQKN